MRFITTRMRSLNGWRRVSPGSRPPARRGIAQCRGRPSACCTAIRWRGDRVFAVAAARGLHHPGPGRPVRRTFLSGHLSHQDFVEQSSAERAACSFSRLMVCSRSLLCSVSCPAFGWRGQRSGRMRLPIHGQNGGHGESLKTQGMNHRLIIIQVVEHLAKMRLHARVARSRGYAPLFADRIAGAQIGRKPRAESRCAGRLVCCRRQLVPAESCWACADAANICCWT